MLENKDDLQANTTKMPLLLAPAGNFEKLVTAIHYGADEIYLGGRAYSLRARAGNFNEDEMKRAIDYAHSHGTKVYVTVNIFAHNRDLEGLEDYLHFLEKADADAIIVADPGILLTAKDTVPHMPVHISTQANVTNKKSVEFWINQGVKRINLARELGINEIREIRRATDAELEVFVHGALCISYSGRCLLSTYLTGRDANKGDCAHPCRYSYRIVEEKRPGEYFPVEEDGRGTYIFNSRDLCLINRLPDIISAGIDAIKIEGRMKSISYVGSTVRIYRAALDWIKREIETGKDLNKIKMPKEFSKEIIKTATRGLTENFFDSPPSDKDMLYETTHTNQDYVPVGIVLKADPLLVETRSPFKINERVEYLGHGLKPVPMKITGMCTEDGTEIKKANPGNRVIIQTDLHPFQAEPHAIIQKKLKQ